MFDNLSIKLDKAFKTLKGQGRITELNVASTIKDIRRALIDADVNYKIAKEVTDKIKKEALGRDVLVSVSPGQLLTKIVSEELARLMGETNVHINLEGNPNIILISGLQGSGKTTFSGKLANLLKKQGRTVLLVACDIYRPAAIEQLKTLGEQLAIDVYTELGTKDVVKIAKNAIKYAKENGKRTIIIDTAGRLAVDEQMMDEISELKKVVKPSETLFVVDSMTGQDAVNIATTFDKRLDYDGVVLTKMDGDTRGGAALSIRKEVDKPIKYISTGEKMNEIELFHPDRMANRILGMGDIVSLVEKAQEVYDEEEARKINKKIVKNQFGFDEFLSQMEQLKKVGSMKDLLKMIPGVGKSIKNVDINDDMLKPIEALIKSMTPKERSNPEILNGSRKKRITKGSGTSIQELNQLVKQFEMMKKMMKMMNKSNGKRAVANMLGIMK